MPRIERLRTVAKVIGCSSEEFMKNKKDSGLCDLCSHWVKCKKRSSSFCLMKDLFTHTDKAIGECCIDFDEGQPITEEEFENWGRQ